MKKQKRPKPRTKRHTKTKTIERDYQQLFTPLQLPYQGLYTDEDSLEQPSELRDVPATSAPYVEV